MAAKGEHAVPKLQSTINESDIIFHEFIGRGGSGDVFKITWKSKKFGNIEAAAKKIPIMKDDDIDEKFGDEINYLQNLSHPNIITYYGHVIIPNYLVIVTEYVSNGSLSDYLKRNKNLPLDLKLKWAIQAVRGIKYLQEKHILHRDIKSSNFLITSDNNLKICDFGIAKDLTTTTTTSNTKGTIRWLAPEAYSFTSNSIVSPKADIFSFGIVLWELETGEVPYKGVRDERVMWLVGHDGVRPEIPASCPPVLKHLMQRCWDGDKNERPDTDYIIEKLLMLKMNPSRYQH